MRHILEQSKETPLAQRASANPNGLYNAITRLIARGDIIRDNDLLYLPLLWHAIKAGQTEDVREAGTGVPGLRNSVLELMADGKWRAARDVFSELPDSAGKQAKKNPQYGYTVLSRLAKGGELERRNGMYRIPGSKDGELPID